MKLFILVLLTLISLETKSQSVFSQINPSIYVGWGLGTNLGGETGIGAEFKYKMISINAAVGTWLGEFPEHTGAKYRYDYDFGIKLYSKIGAFLGINYGIIGASLATKTGQQLLDFQKNHGFSFTLGYRHSLYKNIYGLGYLGLTSDKNENMLNLFGLKSFIPRIGLLIGYEFNSSH